MVKNLRMLRHRRKISQQQLADVIGISQQSVNKYENHKIEPDIQTLMKLADFFETSVDFLIGHTEIDHIIEPVTHCDLNQSEIRLLNNYRKLSSKQKQSIELVIENYLKL